MPLTLKIVVIAIVAITDLLAGMIILKRMTEQGNRERGILIAKVLFAGVIILAIVLFVAIP